MVSARHRQRDVAALFTQRPGQHPAGPRSLSRSRGALARETLSVKSLAVVASDRTVSALGTSKQNGRGPGTGQGPVADAFSRLAETNKRGEGRSAF